MTQLATGQAVRAPFDGRPTIYLYDRVPGGIGLARRAFGMDRQIVRAALEMTGRCACAEGCPTCVGPPLEAGETAKPSARFLLQGMLA